ncbi:hypothetical protein Dimus_005672 [Dionaea muscipula]
MDIRSSRIVIIKVIGLKSSKDHLGFYRTDIIRRGADKADKTMVDEDSMATDLMAAGMSRRMKHEPSSEHSQKGCHDVPLNFSWPILRHWSPSIHDPGFRMPRSDAMGSGDKPLWQPLLKPELLGAAKDVPWKNGNLLRTNAIMIQ